jgi:branched-chain amino acid transport system permease protein
MRFPTMLVISLLASVVYLAGPSFLSTHAMLLLALIGTTSIITAGLSIVTGVAGQITLAQAAFSGLGAYGATILVMQTGLPMWATIPLAALAVSVTGFGLGILSLRVEGHYLALVTLAFGGIVHLGLLHLEPLTGGAVGLPAEPLTVAGFTFGSPVSLYYLCIGCAALVLSGLSSMLRSRWGRAFAGLRQSEMACQSLGIDVRRMKAMAFALSAGLGALGGALQSLQTTYLDPGQFTILSGVSYLSVLVIGGLRSLSGAVIGAVIFVMAPELLGVFSAYMGLVFAAVLIGFILLAPAGIEELVRRALRGGRRGAAR